MADFQTIYDAAINRRGEVDLHARLSTPSNNDELIGVSDDRYLSQMAFRIFSTGLRQDMVRGKWPEFEQAFHNFDPARVGFMNEEDLDQLLSNERIIRHAGKIKATFHNAAAMHDIAHECGGFGHYLVGWTPDNLNGLWLDLGKRFKHLGGNSGPYFLRMVGKDTFTLSNDVIRGLQHWCGLEDAAKNKSTIKLAHEQFNTWAKQTGRPFCQISMILALSV